MAEKMNEDTTNQEANRQETQENVQQKKEKEVIDYWTAAIYDFPEFEKEEIQVFIESFHEFDKDSSGGIDKKEFMEALKSMGQGITEQEIDFLFQKFDLDKSGTIEWPEWLGIMRYFYPWKLIEFEEKYLDPAKAFPEFSKKDILKFIASFRNFDLDGNGSISALELQYAFSNLGQPCSEEEMAQLIAEFDVNQNGEIDWPEFLSIMRFFYKDKIEEYKKTFIEPAKDFPEFSRLEIAIFIEAFHEYDLNNNGTIDASELKLVFKAMGQGSSDQEVKSFMDKVDPKQTGELSFVQFLQVMRLIYSSKKENVEKTYYEPAKQLGFAPEETRALIEAFREFDLDGDGVISAYELWNAFQSVGLEITKQGTLALLSEFDTNKNGVIEWVEFLNMMKKLNGDPYETKNSKQNTAPSLPKTQSPVTPEKKPQVQETKNETEEKKPKTAWKTASLPSLQRGYTPNPKCDKCGKTIYAMEGGINVINKSWHKGCFKCSNCGVNLSQTSFKASDGQIYCSKHVPASKPNISTDSLGISGVLSAPKTQRVQGVKKDRRLTFSPGKINPELFK